MVEDLFSLRERWIFSTLKELKACDFVVIGGYAVNAYTLPRFSVDCDIVVEKPELVRIEEILFRAGYRKRKLPEEENYSRGFWRYEMELHADFAVSVDILIGNVTDRMSGVVFPADWIFKNSRMRTLKGKTIAGEVMLRIINIDALLVMKIISCRSTDIRDVFMMFPKAHDRQWIASEVKARYSLEERLQKIITKISSKQFKDGLSGVYGKLDQTTFDRHKKALEEFLAKSAP